METLAASIAAETVASGCDLSATKDFHSGPVREGEQPYLRNLNMRDSSFSFGITALWSIFGTIKCDRTGETKS